MLNVSISSDTSNLLPLPTTKKFGQPGALHLVPQMSGHVPLSDTRLPLANVAPKLRLIALGIPLPTNGSPSRRP